MVSAWHTVAFVIMLLPVSLCAKLASKYTSKCWQTRFAALALVAALSLSLSLIRKYQNIKYIYTKRCILLSLIHLRCELLSKECKGGNDNKVMVMVVVVLLYDGSVFCASASAFALRKF